MKMWGKKIKCLHCNTKFYDFKQKDTKCPKCSKSQVVKSKAYKKTDQKKILDLLQIKQIYLIFLFFSLIISIFYSYHLTIRFPNLIDDNYNLVVKNIPFAYGDLIHNLIYNNEYSCE